MQISLPTLGAVLLAGALVAPATGAQVATAPELKAAFLFNFVKFTSWPAGAFPDGVAITMCVIGDNRVASALDRLTDGQQVAGRGVAVARLGDRDDLQGCQLLYSSGLGSDRERRLIGVTRGRPILTASDSSTFVRHGGIAAFHIERGRMRFSVNPAAAERAELRISSRLLSLAVIVKTPMRNLTGLGSGGGSLSLTLTGPGVLTSAAAPATASVVVLAADVDVTAYLQGRTAQSAVASARGTP